MNLQGEDIVAIILAGGFVIVLILLVIFGSLGYLS